MIYEFVYLICLYDIYERKYYFLFFVIKESLRTLIAGLIDNVVSNLIN